MLSDLKGDESVTTYLVIEPAKLPGRDTDRGGDKLFTVDHTG